jgi:hypothetical protein
MGGSLAAEKIAWVQRALGVSIPQGMPEGTPARRDSAYGTLGDMLSASGVTLGFDAGADGGAPGGPPDAGVPTPDGGTPDAPPPDPNKQEEDAKKVLAAMQDWKNREARITITYEMDPLLKTYKNALKAFNDAVKLSSQKNDSSFALNAMGGVETALAAMETVAKELPKKQKAATDAGDRLDRMSDDAIAKMKPEDKAALVKQMLGAGKPSGKLREMQKKLYRDTEVDADFRKDDQKRQDKVAATLKGDKELARERASWGGLDKEGLRKALGRIVAAQSKEYGISPARIIFYPDEEKPVTRNLGRILGYFGGEDGMLHINLDPTAGIKDFNKTIVVVLHENMHHYQAELVKMLEANTLKATDPRYKQALLFQVNRLAPGGYIDPDESTDKGKAGRDYAAQPVERSAFETGNNTAAKVTAG